MATLGPDPRPHSQLASASIQSNISGNNLPPNRGLERALEEGANSGFMNLSARKLKEYPRTASNYDLSDTVEAGKNRQCRIILLNLFRSCAQESRQNAYIFGIRVVYWRRRVFVFCVSDNLMCGVCLN